MQWGNGEGKGMDAPNHLSLSKNGITRKLGIHSCNCDTNMGLTLAPAVLLYAFFAIANLAEGGETDNGAIKDATIKGTSGRKLWQAAHYVEFAGVDLALMTGKRADPELEQEYAAKPPERSQNCGSQTSRHKRSLSHQTGCEGEVELPREFDARKHWPLCAKVIGNIRNQGPCGSCWAVSASSVVSDRICIASNGRRKVNVSARELISCVERNGCSGSSAFYAMNYWRRKGLFSSECQPYPGTEDENEFLRLTKNKCHKGCEPSSARGKLPDGTKHYGTEPTLWREGTGMDEAAIRRQIYDHGPVVASMRVYEEFVSYKSGIYKASNLIAKGYGHHVRLIGWGEEREDEVRYWLAANSWGDQWGEKGLFRIVRGENEVGIEEEVIFATPDLGRD